MSDDDLSASGKEVPPTESVTKWVLVERKRTHSHDVRALTIAVPISSEGQS